MPYRALLDSKHKVTALDQARRLVQSASELVLKAEKLAEEARAEGVPRGIWSTPLDALYTEADEAMGAAITALVNTNWDYKDVLTYTRLKGFSGGKFVVKGAYLWDNSDSGCFPYMLEDQDIIQIKNFDTTAYNRGARITRVSEGDQRVNGAAEDGLLTVNWTVNAGWTIVAGALTAAGASGVAYSVLKSGALTSEVVEAGRTYRLMLTIHADVVNTGHLQVYFLSDAGVSQIVYDTSDGDPLVAPNVVVDEFFTLTAPLAVGEGYPSGVLYVQHSDSFVGYISRISILPAGLLELDFDGGAEDWIEQAKGSVTLERRMYAD